MIIKTYFVIVFFSWNFNAFYVQQIYSYEECHRISKELDGIAHYCTDAEGVYNQILKYHKDIDNAYRVD